MYCLRGTNQLEGWHQHLKRAIGYNSASSRLTLALLMAIVYQWNIRIGIAHRGEPDFGTYRLDVLENVCKLGLRY